MAANTAVNNQKLRKNGSPSIKQGPIKATQQFGLNSSPSRGQPGFAGSPVMSTSPGPSRKSCNRPVSDTRILGSSSPAATAHKSVSTERLRSSTSTSSSIESLMAPYLSGQWPKDLSSLSSSNPTGSAMSVTSNNGAFTSDKQTQTPDSWDDLTTSVADRRRPKSAQSLSPYRRSHSVGSGDHQSKSMKYKLQKTVNHSNGSNGSNSRLSPSVYGCVSGINAAPLSVPHASQPIKIPALSSTYAAMPPHGTPGKARASVEGLNQEVEKLIICGRRVLDRDDNSGDEMDGHRAPVVELLTQTTQTPIESCGSYSSFIHLSDSLPNDPLPIMFEVSELNAAEAHDGSGSMNDISDRSHSVCSTTDDSEERCASVSPSFIPGEFELDDEEDEGDRSSLQCHTQFSNTAWDRSTMKVTKATKTVSGGSELFREPPDGEERTTRPSDHCFAVPAGTVRFQPSATSAFKCLPNQRLTSLSQS